MAIIFPLARDVRFAWHGLFYVRVIINILWQYGCIILCYIYKYHTLLSGKSRILILDEVLLHYILQCGFYVRVSLISVMRILRLSHTRPPHRLTWLPTAWSKQRFVKTLRNALWSQLRCVLSYIVLVYVVQVYVYFNLYCPAASFKYDYRLWPSDCIGYGSRFGV